MSRLLKFGSDIQIYPTDILQAQLEIQQKQYKHLCDIILAF